jgi:tetratricopeptide (TPR) repeat protein
MRHTIVVPVFACLAACASTQKPAEPPSLSPSALPLTLTSSSAPSSPDADQVKTLQTEADAHCQQTAARPLRDTGYEEALRAQQAAPQDRDIGLILSRCSLMKADFEGKADRRMELCEQGYEAARRVTRGPDDAESAYLQAVNLGLFVQAKGMMAVGRLSELVKLLKVAGKQPQLDDGGPWRVLGLLYVKAPAWPVGPGDLDQGLDLLKKAVEAYPEHPLNHLFYAEALIADGQKPQARAELERTRALATPQRFGDWSTRWQNEANSVEAKAR